MSLKELMKLMGVVCWMMGLVGMKRVVVKHKREDDERVRKRVEVHQDSVVVIVDDDYQMWYGRCCQ